MDEERQRCTRCILTDAFPGISFDADGVCCYCRRYERVWRGRPEVKGSEAFRRVVERAKARGRRYDALAGISGGKDSCYALHLLVKDYGARVLAYTYDNGFLADGARANIELMVRRLGVDHEYVALPPALQGRLYQALTANECADLCMPCALGALAAANRLVLRHRCPLVVWGFSPRTDPVLPLEMLNSYDVPFLRHAVRPYLSGRELAFFNDAGLFATFRALFLGRCELAFIPEYVSWRDEAIIAFLESEYGWKDYGVGRPHFDCVVNPMMDFFMRRRLGIGRPAERLSLLVRCGRITREEALEALAREHDDVQAEAAMDTFCARMGVERGALEPYLEGAVRDYRHFPGHARLLQRLHGLFRLAHRWAGLPDSIEWKFRRP